MKLPLQDAAKIISQNPHADCRRSLGTQFRKHIYRDEHGRDQVKAQGICWLYCWATTGQGSAKAARQAKDAFDQIFDPDHDWLQRRLSLEMARKFAIRAP